MTKIVVFNNMPGLIFRYCFFLIVFAHLGIPHLVGQSFIVDKVVARVGSEFILLSEVEEEFSYLKVSDPKMTDAEKCVILESLIAQKLIIYHAKLDSVEVSDAEVEAQLELRFASILRQMNGDEEFFKEYYGASINEMKERYRDDQKQKILAERMQYQLIQDINITPDEVLEFFSRIPVDSLPYFNAEVELSEIVIKPEVNNAEKMKALELSEDLRKRIVEDGEDFALLAKKYSQDPGSAAKGGDLGFAKRGVYVPEFEAVAFGLAKDEISDVFETEYGFHFMQMIERRGNSVRLRHILISPEITKNDEELAHQKLDSIRILILADSMSFEEAVKKFSIKNLPSYSNNGRLRNPNTGTNFFETNEIDPTTYFAMEDLKAGEITTVMKISEPGRGNVYRMVKLDSWRRPHKANLREDYDKITYFAKESKKSEYFAKWIKEKLSRTYVEVDPLYFHCENVDQWVKLNFTNSPKLKQ
jgi:peptidyl-prolyl cis-trans isomerase SurA